MWTLYGIYILVFINYFIGTWFRSFIYILSMAAFAELSSCDRNDMVHKSKIFTVWPFVESNLPTSALEYFINLEMLALLES